MSKKKDNHYMEKWYSTVHYYGPDGPSREFLAAEDQVREEFNKFQKVGPTEYGDVNGEHMIAAEKYQQALELEKRRKEKARKKKWINKITNETSAAEYDLGTTVEDEDIYAYNRERRLEELNDEYEIAQRIIEIKKYILSLKRKLKTLVDNPPNDLENFNYLAYQIQCYSIQSEIFEWQKRIDYYTDPVVGYNVKVDDIVPTEEEYVEKIKEEEKKEEESKSWTEKLMCKVNKFSERHIDPILKMIKKFIKRNEKALNCIFKFAVCIIIIGMKFFDKPK